MQAVFLRFFWSRNLGSRLLAGSLAFQSSVDTDPWLRITKNRSAQAMLSRNTPLETRNSSAKSQRVTRLDARRGNTLRVVAESGVEPLQRICGEIFVLTRKVLPKSAYLSAAHFKRLRITHITRTENFRIENPSCF